MQVLVAQGLVFGHLMNQDDILVDMAKIEVVIQWEVPTDGF